MMIQLGSSLRHRPVVELLLEPGSAKRLAPLVRALATVARPSAPEHGQAVHARLLSSPFAPEASKAQREAAASGVPYAVLVDQVAAVDHPVTAQATVVLTGDLSVAERLADRALMFSAHSVDTAGVLPVPLHVRARLRARHGFPTTMVLTVGRPGSVPLATDNLATALRLASVVNAVGPIVADAMALGAPVVTDAATAESLGASPEVAVLVANGAGAARVAEDLAGDEGRAARLAREGRRLVEERHDPILVVRVLVQRLGLVPASAWPVAAGARLGARLAELGTPPGHAIETQLSNRLGDLDVAVRSGGA